MNGKDEKPSSTFRPRNNQSGSLNFAALLDLLASSAERQPAPESTPLSTDSYSRLNAIFGNPSSPYAVLGIPVYTEDDPILKISQETTTIITPLPENRTCISATTTVTKEFTGARTENDPQEEYSFKQTRENTETITPLPHNRIKNSAVTKVFTEIKRPRREDDPTEEVITTNGMNAHLV